MSTVTELARVLTPENRAEVLPRFFGLSRREAEAVAATLRPAEVVPTRDVVTSAASAVPALRAVVTPAAPPAPSPSSPLLVGRGAVHMDEPVDPAQGAAPHERIDPVVMVAPARLPPPAPPPPRESVEHRDAELARLHVTVSRRFLAKLEAAKHALGHACPGGGAAEILERGLDLLLAEHAQRRGLVEKPRKAQPPSRRDTIPAAVKREVWRRAGGRCEWTFASGERCGCRRRLEFDHIEPLALGGESTVANVRLACRPHDLLAARLVFGDAVVDRHARRPPTPARHLPCRAAAFADGPGPRASGSGASPPA